MVFDLDMIRGKYAEISEKIEETRKLTGRPLTLTEMSLGRMLGENRM